MWHGMGDAARLAWDGLKGLLAQYRPQEMVLSAWEGVATFFEDLWARVTSIFTAAWAAIDANVIQPMRAAVAFMTDNALTRSAGAVRDKVGDWFGGERAAGGPVSAGQAYLVCERGPEIFAPGRSGFVTPNEAAFPRVPAAVHKAIAPRTPPAVQMPANGNWSPREAIQYVRAADGGSSSITIDAPVTIEMKGGDKADMELLDAKLREHRRQIMAELEAAQRRKDRRRHG